MNAIAVAALSARQAVEAARADGVAAVALDLFGDRDTVRAARSWRSIGAPDVALRVDPARLRHALAALARSGTVQGLVVGSGFEAEPALLADAAARLRLLGCAPADVARVRDPRAFFDGLRRDGIAHPAVRFEPPSDPRGWLAKDAASCGGAGVRRASRAPAPFPAGVYWQAELADARPLSLTFVADGRRARVIGLNEQLVEPAGALPYGFAGVIGPLPALLPRAQRALDHALQTLARTFRLVGIGSLDFLLDRTGQPQLLEVNPRWPASAALHAHMRPMRLHLAACLEAVLPPALPAATRVEGWRIVRARRALTIDAVTSAHLVARVRVHDLPQPDTIVPAGAPLCSVSATGADAAAVRAALIFAHDALLDDLETLAP